MVNTVRAAADLATITRSLRYANHSLHLISSPKDLSGDFAIKLGLCRLVGVSFCRFAALQRRKNRRLYPEDLGSAET